MQVKQFDDFQVKRINTTNVIQLVKYNNTELNNWDPYLYPIVFAYNTSARSLTTNLTLFGLC